MKKQNKVISSLIMIALVVGLIAGVYGYTKEIDDSKQGATSNTDSTIKPDNNDVNKDDGNDVEIVAPDIEITLAATGDIMFHPRQIKGAYNSADGTYDFKKYFEPVKKYLESADITVGNFEGTTCGDDLYAYQGYPLFNAPDEVLDALKYVGFDVLSTVNNHSLDTRKTGVIRTIEKIHDRGLDNVGTYVEKPETRVIIKDVKGIKIAFLAYTEMLNGLESVISPEDLDSMINVIDRTKIKEDIDYAKKNEADLIVTFVHWGDEYNTSPHPRQEELAEYMLSEGVDVILGSHPHVMQDTSSYMYNDKRVFVSYSLGNFISNQRYEEGLPEQTEDGVIAKLTIKKDGKTGETTIKNVEYTPTWVYRVYSNTTGLFDYRVLPVMEYIESDDIPNDAKVRMQRSYNDTLSKMHTGMDN